MQVNQYFYDLAKIASKKAAENGINVDPTWIYTQWHIETSGFTSNAQIVHHNLGGITSRSGGWMHFNNYPEFANYFGKYLSYYKEDGIGSATNLYSYLQALHHGGYFATDVNTYYNSFLHVLNSLSF